MVNYQVYDLNALLDLLRNEGVTVVGNVEDSEYGKFSCLESRRPKNRALGTS